MSDKTQKTWDLFRTFFRIGLFTFGGGYAMLPLIQTEAVEEKHWVTADEVLDIVAIAESTPGPLAINSATFIGYRVAGIMGSAAATFGVVLPSYIVICTVSLCYHAFMQNKWVACAFRGIHAGVVMLIVNAVLKLGKGCPRTVFSLLLFLAGFILTAFLSVDSKLILIGAALCGIAASVFYAKEKGGSAK
ncbi:MAG: chromate transporter [Christensenellales bacterium]|jgi:chromate transporter